MCVFTVTYQGLLKDWILLELEVDKKFHLREVWYGSWCVCWSACVYKHVLLLSYLPKILFPLIFKKQQATELDGLKRYLEFKEEEEKLENS